MFAFIKKLFGGKEEVQSAPVVDVKVEAANAVPYKVEVPAAVVPASKVERPAAKKKPAGKKPAGKKPGAPAARKPKAKPAV